MTPEAHNADQRARAASPYQALPTDTATVVFTDPETGRETRVELPLGDLQRALSTGLPPWRWAHG